MSGRVTAYVVATAGETYKDLLTSTDFDVGE